MLAGPNDAENSGLSTALLSPPPRSDSHRFTSEFGAWQLRHFTLVSLAWALNAFHTMVIVLAFHTMVIVLADREPAGRCMDWVGGVDCGRVGAGEKYKVRVAQSAFFFSSLIIKDIIEVVGSGW